MPVSLEADRGVIGGSDIGRIFPSPANGGHATL